MKKITFLLFVALLAGFLFAGVASAGKKVSSVEGTVVDAYGKPLKGIKVVARQKEPLKGYEKFETTTNSDGSFVFKGLYPGSEYEIAPEGVASCNMPVPTMEIRSAPAGHVRLLKGDIKVNALLKVTRDGVIVDLITDLEWAPDSGRPMNWDQANQYAQSLDIAGGGWRLPTMQELHTIYTPYCEGHILHPAFTLGKNNVWSSQMDGPTQAWEFDFNTGKAKLYSTPRADPNLYYGTHVLAVRSGK